MGFGEAISTCLRKYATFSGRARRSEYWFFYLFTILLGIPVAIVDGLISAGTGQKIQIVQPIVSLALFLPSTGAMVRRLHDTEHSGWLVLGFFAYFLVGVIVVIAVLASASAGLGGAPNFTGAGGILTILFVLGGLGFAIYMLVLLASNGTDGANKYGSDPKGPEVDVFS